MMAFLHPHLRVYRKNQNLHFLHYRLTNQSHQLNQNRQSQNPLHQWSLHPKLSQN
jgi:hypothetical protein